MDDFKRENVKDYTAWDLNCRQILPHDKKKNNLEKKFTTLCPTPPPAASMSPGASASNIAVIP